MDDTITITIDEYKELLKDSIKLRLLFEYADKGYLTAAERVAFTEFLKEVGGSEKMG